jgi:hypothetical protein
MLTGFKVIKFIEQWVFCVPQTTVRKFIITWEENGALKSQEITNQ